jgi:hypothetical protein
MEFISHNKIDLFGIAETKIQWNDTTAQIAQSKIKQSLGHHIFSTSNSTISTPSLYQPGGTATTACNAFIPRHAGRCNDPTNLGRWSGFKFHTTHNKLLYIITAYRPHIDNKPQSNTTYQQQRKLLRDQGITSPEPRQLLLKDLTEFITTIQKQQDDIILMWDANESANTPKMQQFLQQTQLYSVAGHTPPELHTYARGNTTIDHIFATQNVVQHVTAAGYLPFYTGAWHSDHRAIFVDLHYKGLFKGEPENILPSTPRNISSKNRSAIIRFLKFIETNTTTSIYDIWQSLQRLSNTKHWNNTHHEQLEQADTQFTELLKKAKESLQTNYSIPWSPQLAEAQKILRFWQQFKSSKLNNIKNTHKIALAEQELGPQLYQGNPNRSFYGQLQRAKQRIRELQRDAITNRQHHLHTCQEIAIIENNKSRAKAITHLLKYEKKQRCFKKLKTQNNIHRRTLPHHHPNPANPSRRSRNISANRRSQRNGDTPASTVSTTFHAS